MNKSEFQMQHYPNNKYLKSFKKTCRGILAKFFLRCRIASTTINMKNPPTPKNHNQDYTALSQKSTKNFTN